MTYAIYSSLFIKNPTENLAFLLIIKLKQHFIILSRPLIKKHRVLLDIIYDFITFFPRFYIYFRINLSYIPSKPIEKIKKIAKTK